MALTASAGADRRRRRAAAPRRRSPWARTTRPRGAARPRSRARPRAAAAPAPSRNEPSVSPWPKVAASARPDSTRVMRWSARSSLTRRSQAARAPSAARRQTRSSSASSASFKRRTARRSTRPSTPITARAVEQRHVVAAPVAATFHEGEGVGREVGIVDVASHERGAFEDEPQVGAHARAPRGCPRRQARSRWRRRAARRLRRTTASRSRSNAQMSTSQTSSTRPTSVTKAVRPPGDASAATRASSASAMASARRGGALRARRRRPAPRGSSRVRRRRRPAPLGARRRRAAASLLRSCPVVIALPLAAGALPPSLHPHSLSAGASRHDRGSTKVVRAACRYCGHPLQNGPGFRKPPRCRDGAQSPGPYPFPGPAPLAVTEPGGSGRLALL